MKKGTLATLVAAAVVVLAGVMYASPYITVAGLQRAVEARDAQGVAEYVDFPALKEDIKGKLLIEITKQGKTELKNNPFAAMGQVLAIGLVNQMADTFISPAGVMLMLEEGNPAASAASKAPEPVPSADTEKRSYKVTYLNWSRVKIAPEGEPNGFIFRRDGLFGWKLVALDLDL
jgi:hypothetical protein